MGLSASQARYQALVARQSDIEYQGQQINQQRTTLSNQINALYNSLLDMSVPTPPSTSDFTKLEYTFPMGTDTFTIESVRPNGSKYTINTSYLDYGHYMQSASTACITNTSGHYYVGDNELKRAGDVVGGGQPILDSEWEGYAEAIRNSFPEYAEYDDEELKEEFFVYFTSVRDSHTQTPHFILASNVLSVDDGESKYYEQYDYLENGSFTAYKKFEDVELTFDAKGLISQVGIPVYDENGVLMTIQNYNATATKVTDQDAYQNAFNQYEVDKYKYDLEQAKINAKTSIIQRDDKNLELKLTRLDNERNAVKTEMDAVKKVIDDSIESGFKTFSG